MYPSSFSTIASLSAPIVTIAIYTPILFLALLIYTKNGAKERAWLLLFLSSSAQIVGGIMLLISATLVPKSPFRPLYYGWFVFDALALALLHLCTLDLFKTISEGSQSERIYKSLGLYICGMAAPVFTIIGVVLLSLRANGSQIALLGPALLLLLWICSIVIVLRLWFRHKQLLKHRRTLLIEVSFALPFLGLRTAYAVFSTRMFLTPNPYIEPDGSPGGFPLYLVLGVLMEYVVVFIYTVTGIVLPLDQEYQRYTLDPNSDTLIVPPGASSDPQAQGSVDALIQVAS